MPYVFAKRRAQGIHPHAIEYAEIDDLGSAAHFPVYRLRSCIKYVRGNRRMDVSATFENLD